MAKYRPEAPPPVEKLPFGTTAVKVGAGTWCFETENFLWKWVEQQGMNLGLRQPEGDYTFQLHCSDLTIAVVYAWGFCYGWKNHAETFKIEIKNIKEKHVGLVKEYEDLVQAWKNKTKKE